MIFTKLVEKKYNFNKETGENYTSFEIRDDEKKIAKGIAFDEDKLKDPFYLKTVLDRVLILFEEVIKEKKS